MSYENIDETESDVIQNFTHTAQGKAQDALEASRTYVRENPIPIIVGAFLLGAGLGYLLSQREKEEKDTAQAARELLEIAYHEVADKIPALKKRYTDGQANLIDQAQNLGQKLKWW
jgi:ElaB/YqjD/DUF883 family membrane-anchored ribosome-binding protein